MAESTEQLFCSALDCADEYMALQQSLGEALRAGFLSLAQARYSMGADRVSALQLPSHMAATARVAATEGGELELVVAEPTSVPSPRSSPASTGSWTAAPVVHEAAPAGGAGEAAAGAATAPAAVSGADTSGAAAAATSGVCEESLDAQLQRLRLAAQQSDGILEQLAAKYGCDGSSPREAASPGGTAAMSKDCPAEDDEYAEVAKPGRPLHWFGSLVAPSLRDAEGHFGRALALAVQAANAQRRLRQGVERYRQGSDLTQLGQQLLGTRLEEPGRAQA